MNRSPWRLEEVDGSPWRLEEVDGGDEQYHVESRFGVRHTPPPISTVALQHKSISSVLRYATPRINRTPFRPEEVRFLRFAVRQTPPNQQDPVPNVGGPFPPLCGTPGLISIGCSVQAGWLPMNTTYFVASR